MPELPVTAPRLFIAPARFAPPAPVLLRGAEHHYLTRVLRLRLGDAVVLLDGGGRLGAARLVRVDAEQVELAWEAATTAPASGPQVILLCGLLKGDKQDFVIQKATELGVSAVVPVLCQRSVPQLGEERAEKRQQRWSRIALSAAQQCRRPDVPRVLLPVSLAAAVQDAAPADPGRLSLLLYEGPAAPLHALLPAASTATAPTAPTAPTATGGADPAALTTVRLLVGPEGGFTDAEVAAATAAGFLPASLGPRILRAETAVVAALAVLQYALAARSAP